LILAKHSADGRPALLDDKRSAIFISHANPEDNTFALWLGAKLVALGFEVWADIMRLRGGDDWQRKLETGLRRRAKKMLLVGTQLGVQKQGVRNEIQIAHDVGKAIGDPEFIIPLRLNSFDAPFLIAHAQYIDFRDGWAKGLKELLETLNSYGVRRISDANSGPWRELQLINGKTLAHHPETLLSNWLPIHKLPGEIRLYDFSGGVNVDAAEECMRSAPWPLIRHLRGFLSFASLDDLKEHFEPFFPLAFVAKQSVEVFLEFGWVQQRLKARDARNMFVDLARQALEQAFRQRGLLAYDLAGRKTAWWPMSDTSPDSKVAFRWRDRSGQRLIRGISAKREISWHFGISIIVRTSPFRYVQVTSHIIFTEDGRAPISESRMHRMRRTFPKSWRNARWRDMLLAFLWWLADGHSEYLVKAGSAEEFAIGLPPLSFVVPVSIPAGVHETESEDEFWQQAEADDDDGDDYQITSLENEEHAHGAL
jgi:hypothetical protein